MLTMIYNVNRTQTHLNIIVNSINSMSKRKMSDDSQQYTLQDEPKRSYKKLTQKVRESLVDKVINQKITIAKAARSLKIKNSASKVFIKKFKEEMAREAQKLKEQMHKEPQKKEDIAPPQLICPIEQCNNYPIFYFYLNPFQTQWNTCFP